MEDFLNLIKEFRKSVFNLNVFIGIIAAIVVFIVEIKWIRSHQKRNKRVDKAISLGHVIDAKRIRMWDDDVTGTNVDAWVYATYTYEVEGKSYKYKYMDRASAPMTMKLYYIDNPRKAFRNKEKKSSFFSILFFVFPIATAVIVINLLGGV